MYAVLTDRFTKDILQDFLNLLPGCSQRIQRFLGQTVGRVFQGQSRKPYTLGALPLVNLILNGNDGSAVISMC